MPAPRLKDNVVRATAGVLVAASAVVAAGNLVSGPAQASVDAPAGTAPFLDKPFNDPAVKLGQGWYYYNGEPGLSCPYAYDLPGARRHCGIDFHKIVRKARQTFPVLASADGTATKSGGGAAGTYLSIEHTVSDAHGSGRLFCTRYLHLDPTKPILVGPVKRGQQVAWAGKSGTRNIHLHWDVRPGGCSSSTSDRVDPFDIAGALLRGGIAPTKYYYPGGSKFTGCGPNRLTTWC